MYTRLIALGASTAITAAGLFFMAPPASAKAPIVVTAPSDIVSRHISYADLNLASLPGERTLNGRVSAAVISLCDEAAGPEDTSFGYRYAAQACKISAWDQARPQISRAVQRARDIASTGVSNIAATAIVIGVPE